jgi:hypothetical protein
MRVPDVLGTESPSDLADGSLTRVRTRSTTAAAFAECSTSATSPRMVSAISYGCHGFSAIVIIS